MVKSKKSVPKKAEEATVENEAVENSVDAAGDEENEKPTQENGEVASTKKKGKGKQAKKEDEDKEETPVKEQNGSGDAKEKKKTPAKKAAKVAAEPARKSSRTPKPVQTTNSDGEAYEVEKLIEFRLHRGKPQYLVRWKGYSKADDTWEDESGLNCPELLQKFKEGNPQSGKKKRAASKSPAKSAKKAKPAKKEPEDYEVEEIVGLRVKNGKKEFKIRWKGYKPSDDSWEPEKHLSCQDLITAYLESHKDEVEALEEKKSPVKKTPAKSNKKGKKSKAK